MSVVTSSFSIPYKCMGNPQVSREHKGLRHTHLLSAKQHREYRNKNVRSLYKGRSAEKDEASTWRLQSHQDSTFNSNIGRPKAKRHEISGG